MEKSNIIEQAGIKTERLRATETAEERIVVTCSPLYFPLTTYQATTLMNMLAWHLRPIPRMRSTMSAAITLRPGAFREMHALADTAQQLMTGTALLGRALTHAYEAGDFTDAEAADFAEAVLTPLITAFAAGELDASFVTRPVERLVITSGLL